MKSYTAPLTVQDHKILHRQTLFVIVFALFFYSVLAAMFFFSRDMIHGSGAAKWFVYFVFAFLAFVCGLIVWMQVGATFSHSKTVKEGIVSDKQIETRHRGGSNSSGNSYYRFRLDDVPIDTTINFFSQVEEGDLARLHFANFQNQLFRVEILKRASGVAISEFEKIDNPMLQSYNMPMSDEDRKILSKSLINQIGWLVATLFIAGFLFVFMILLLVLLFEKAKPGAQPNMRWFFYGIALLVIGLVYWLNRLLVRKIKDLVRGEKTVVSDQIASLQSSNRPMIHKYTTVTTGTPGNYRYALTASDRFVSVSHLNVKTGDRLEIHMATHSGYVLSVQKSTFK